MQPRFALRRREPARSPLTRRAARAITPAPDIARTFNIAQAGQTITFDPIADRTFGDPAFEVSASASSGLPVTCRPLGSAPSKRNHRHPRRRRLLHHYRAPGGEWQLSLRRRWCGRSILPRRGRPSPLRRWPDRTFGDPAFDVSASASSGLPVSLSGQRDRAPSTGSDRHPLGRRLVHDYRAAGGQHATTRLRGGRAVVRHCQGAGDSLTVGTEFTYDGTVKQASVTTSPAGLSGVTCDLHAWSARASPSRSMPAYTRSWPPSTIRTTRRQPASRHAHDSPGRAGDQLGVTGGDHCRHHAELPPS